MIADALKYLVGIGQKTAELKLIELPGNKLAVNVDGVLQMFDGNARRVALAVGDLASLVDWCEQAQVDDDLVDEMVQVVVGGKDIRAEISPSHPHLARACSMPLAVSAAAETLLNWSKSPAAQKTVVRALRGPLAGCFDESYLSVFRALDFSRRSDGSKTIEHAKESLGRSIEAAAQSRGGEIPQIIAFTVPMFAMDFPGCVQKLRYAVDVDADAEQIGINPLGGCAEDAFRFARDSIVQWLRGQLPEAQVYLGA